jgi:hypothetical protein
LLSAEGKKKQIFLLDGLDEADGLLLLLLLLLRDVLFFFLVCNVEDGEVLHDLRQILVDLCRQNGGFLLADLDLLFLAVVLVVARVRGGAVGQLGLRRGKCRVVFRLVAARIGISITRKCKRKK